MHILVAGYIPLKENNAMKKILYTKSAPEPIGPYSQAIQAGGFIFVSGQIAIDSSTGDLLITEDIAAETELVLNNLQSILQAAGYSMQDVVKCSIFLKNMQQFAEVNAVYGKYFQSDPPARETVEVSALPKGVRVEISAIAYK